MHIFLVQCLSNYVQIQKDAHFIVFPSGGTASPDFCFFADIEGNLLSCFLFFSIAAWACSSCKLRSAVSVDVVLGSCALGLSSAGGHTSGGDTLLALSGSGPNLSVSRGCVGGGSGAEHDLSIAGATSVSAWIVGLKELPLRVSSCIAPIWTWIGGDTLVVSEVPASPFGVPVAVYTRAPCVSYEAMI
jgi:hypothetical protein